MKKILEIKNLSVSFANNKDKIFKAVKNVSFNVYEGEILGVVGESGSGKSVTALSIPQLLEQYKAIIDNESSIKLNDMELINADESILNRVRGNKIGFIFQEPMSSLNPLHRIGDQISENLIQHQNIGYKKAKQEAVKLLKMVGIKNSEQRYKSYPFELSGGQRQRVMIAMAVANTPQILIADEPTTALDVTVQEQILNIIQDFKKRLNMSVIFISHDLQLVKKIADRIIVMYQGEIVEENTASELFGSPKHSYTKKLISSNLSLKNHNKIEDGEIVNVKNLLVKYPIKKNFFGKSTMFLNALNNVSFSLYKGETLGIVGESGSGKTTLGMCFAKLIKFEGNIIYNRDLNKKEFRKYVQIIFQDPYNSLNPRFNVFQIISEGLRVHFPQYSENDYINEVIGILKEVGLSETDLYKYPHEFSGGQRQRIAIARSLVLKPEILILDEPTSALDVTVQAQIIDLLKSLQIKYKMTYVFISHDMRAIKSISDRIAVMKDGKLVEINKSSEVINNPQEEYTKNLIKASLL